ncbi:hypothetical protein Tco_1295062 [Tanacetum coccineum]
MQNLEMQFSNETLHEKDSNSELRAIKGQFEHFIHSKMFELSKYNTNAREILQDFNAYTSMEAQTFKETIIQNMDSIEQCIIERASHEQELKMKLKKLSERQLQIQKCKVQEVQSSVTSSGDETSSGIVSDEEIEKKELEAHNGFMAKIQEVLPVESSSIDMPLEQVQNHDASNVFANERRHSEQPKSINGHLLLTKCAVCAACMSVCAALANLIANLTLDTEENKTILKQLKKANASLTQELKECKTNLDETSRALGEATSSRDSCLIALQTKQTELEKYTALRTTVVIIKYFKQIVNQKHDELVKKSLLNRSQFEGQLKEKTKIPKPSVLGKPTPFSNSPEMRNFQTNKSVNKTNVSDGLFKPVTQQSLPQNRNQAVRNTNVLKPGMFRIASTTTQTRTPQLPHASRNTNPHMSKSSGVIHTTSVSRPQLKSYQVKDKISNSFRSNLSSVPASPNSLEIVQLFLFIVDSGCQSNDVLMRSQSSSLGLHGNDFSDHNRSELGIHDHSNEPSSLKLVPKVVPLAVKIATSRKELELLFHHHIAMLRGSNGGNGNLNPIQMLNSSEDNTIIESSSFKDKDFRKNLIERFSRVVVGCRGTAAEVREGAARDREWVWGSDRSVDKEYIWSSPEKPAGKVFRRRRGDGRRWLVAAGYYGREGREI